MRFIKYFSALLILLCFCVTGGCNLKIELSPSDKSLIDLASKIYSESQLLEIVKFKGTINELNSQYPIECLRNDNGIYRASYMGYSSIAVLLFDNVGNKFWGNIHSIQLLKSCFDGLTKGQTIEEVRAVDPDGEYLFLCTGRSDMPRVSFHYTKDGFLITIEYDDLNNIINITEELV